MACPELYLTETGIYHRLESCAAAARRILFHFYSNLLYAGHLPLVSMRGWNHKQTKLLLKPLSCCCLRDSTWNFPWQNCRLTLLYSSTSKLKLFTFSTAVWAKSNFSQSQWPCSMREAVQQREQISEEIKCFLHSIDWHQSASGINLTYHYSAKTSKPVPVDCRKKIVTNIFWNPWDLLCQLDPLPWLCPTFKSL